MKTSSSLFFVCLNEKFGKEVCRALADLQGKVFVDCNEEISQTMLEREVYRRSCTLEYLDALENECLTACLKRENSIIILTYEHYIRNKSLFDGIKIYYLQLPALALSEKDKINKLAFFYRNKELSALETINLMTADREDAINKIVEKIGEKT